MNTLRNTEGWITTGQTKQTNRKSSLNNNLYQSVKTNEQTKKYKSFNNNQAKSDKKEPKPS